MCRLRPNSGDPYADDRPRDGDCCCEVEDSGHVHGGYPADLNPSLTTAPNVFLRGGSFTGASVWNNASGGYTITYAQTGGGTDYTLTSSLAGCP